MHTHASILSSMLNYYNHTRNSPLGIEIIAAFSPKKSCITAALHHLCHFSSSFVSFFLVICAISRHHLCYFPSSFVLFFLIIRVIFFHHLCCVLSYYVHSIQSSLRLPKAPDASVKNSKSFKAFLSYENHHAW